MATFSIGNNVCYATLIAPSWALTAAHCFQDTLPIGSGNLGFPASFEAENVRFHPKAWQGQYAEETWNLVHPPETTNWAFDLALVQLAHPVTDHTPAKLYHPASPPSLQGQWLFFGGSGGTGKAGIVGLANSPQLGGKVLVVGKVPSASEAGDSGAGGLVSLDETFPDSVGFQSPCAVPPGDPPGELLVGVLSHGDGEDYYAPVFLPETVEWIASTMAAADGDGICDDEDNCPTVFNDQANCNILAEQHTLEWGSNGIDMGDACAQATCPEASLQFKQFVPGSFQPDPFWIHGRNINDTIALKPVLAPSNDAISSLALPLFCVCKDSEGNPINDPLLCKEPPHYCKLDPRQALGQYYVETGGGTPPGQLETYWHRMSIYQGPKQQPAKQAIPISYPGNTVHKRWAYKQDYQAWLNNAWVEPSTPSPFFPDGTDLTGVLWAHDEAWLGESGAGAAEHGIALCPVSWPPEGATCSISDGFVYGVAPDPRTKRSHNTIPQLKPAAWWTYCPVCGDIFHFLGETIIDPAPFVTLDPITLDATVWLAQGGSYTEALSPDLIQSLVDPATRWVVPSEPVSITNNPPLLPPAVQLAATGDLVKGIALRSTAGFGLQEVIPDPQARRPHPSTGFGVAYSRTAGALYVIGGITDLGTLNRAWTWRSDNGWTAISSGVDLQPAELTPVNVSAAVFSHRDWRVWLVDERPEGKRLLRVDPATGDIDTFTSLALLDSMSELWLTTVEDGRVLLAGNGQSFQLALLEAAPFTPNAQVSVTSVLQGSGELAMSPVVRYGLISLASEIQLDDGTYALQLASVSVAELADLATGGKITICHVPPGNPDNAHAITVAAPAVDAHLAHGDVLGACH